jgi:perosamine synthetase
MTFIISKRFAKTKITRYLNARRAFSWYEFFALMRAGWYYSINRIDPLYQGVFESEYTNAFTEFMGGGFADAVNSGTNACYICIKSLLLESGSKVGISCFTDPGVFNAVLTAGHEPLPLPFISDEDWRVDLNMLDNLIKEQNLKALIIVHTFGQPDRIEEISELCKKYQVFLIEDFSQAHGASYKGQMVGKFGDLSFCSTMGRKTLASGSIGGLIFTQDENLFQKVRSFSDRGKSVNNRFETSPLASMNIHVSLNFSADEFLCAIGKSSLTRLHKSRLRRIEVTNKFSDIINASSISSHLNIDWAPPTNSPFVAILNIKSDELLKQRKLLVDKLSEAHVPLNSRYIQIAPLWPWLEKNFEVTLEVNSHQWSDRHLIIYLHEGYKDWYINYLAQEIISSCKSLFPEQV